MILMYYDDVLLYVGCVVDVIHAYYEHNFRLLEKGMKIDLFKLDMNILHYGGTDVFHDFSYIAFKVILH